MKNRIPDMLAIFRVLIGPVILYLILLDGRESGFMIFPAVLAFIGAWTDYFDGIGFNVLL